MPARAIGVRPLVAADLDAARTLFLGDAGPPPYFSRARAAMEHTAAQLPGSLALVAEADAILGALLGGDIAGPRRSPR